MTNELREKMTRRLIEKGMSKAQATSKTAEACYDALMPDDSSALIEDAYEVVGEMRQKYNSMIERLEYVAQVIEASKDKRISDEKAQNIVGLFASLLDISLNSRKKYVDDEVFVRLDGSNRREYSDKLTGTEVCSIIKDISYIVYAYANTGTRADISRKMQDDKLLPLDQDDELLPLDEE